MRLKQHLYCIGQECLLLYKSLVFKCVQRCMDQVVLEQRRKVKEHNGR